MKKRAFVRSGALASSVLLAGSLLSACGLYGPPPERRPTEPPVQATENIPEPVYGPPEDDWSDYDPANNIPEVVYGPPEDDWSDYDPANNIPEDVYGPPSFFGMEDEEPEEAEETLP